ncbi:type II toxin-antitoxin system RelE/ParE family toxin [Plastoroseomonas hellenica]|nr:type II toxin-antitoxin system RelE/ParE family toxin [Plastoroseomonas hellenica]
MLGRRGRAKGTREFVLPDTPYIIVYRVTDRVEILAVVHAAREWPEGFE